jgi:hypothetical protein
MLLVLAPIVNLLFDITTDANSVSVEVLTEFDIYSQLARKRNALAFTARKIDRQQKFSAKNALHPNGSLSCERSNILQAVLALHYNFKY